jgi:methylglutaconyl-CoA hydratase
MPAMASWTSLDLQRRGDGVAVLTMNRPAVFNAFDETLIAELDAAFAELGGDDSVRAIVLAGAGKHFSAGADLQWMQRAAAASQDDNLADARRFSAMLARIAECPKPTLARVQGAALGGGVGLVAACDMAVASEAASFSVSEAKMGILPAVIGPHLVNAVGLREARRRPSASASCSASCRPKGWTRPSMPSLANCWPAVPMPRPRSSSSMRGWRPAR